MNKRVSFGCVFFLLLFVVGCSTIRVSTDFNPTYDFTKLRTYAWLDNDKAVSSDARVNNDLIVDRVRRAVENSLAAKGYTKIDAASADFVVSWFGAIDTKLQVDSIDHFYSPYGYGALVRDPYWNGTRGVRTTTTREYEVGTLIVDILDPSERKLIWRGSGTDRIGSNNSPEKVTKGINEAIAAIMASFPSLIQQ